MKIRLTLNSFNKNFLSLAKNKINSIFELNKIEIISISTLPTKIRKFCVLRSPHVDKNSREQFEIRVFKCIIDFNVKNVFLLNAFFQIELPSGIFSSIKIII